MSSNIEVRKAARLLLADAKGRLLLFRYSDGHGRELWATPGGGVESGESVEQAARREAFEELGVKEVDLSRLWTSQVEFVFANRRISQTETFFWVNRYAGVLRSDISEHHRLEGIVEMRWWSLDELGKTEEQVFPPDLAVRVRRRAAK